MDFSALLGSQGNVNLIGALMPLLLGVKGNTPDLLSSLMNSFGKVPSSETDYPPLFGVKEVQNNGSFPAQDLMKLLGGFSREGKSATQKKESTSYPYELQYNRPYSEK